MKRIFLIAVGCAIAIGCGDSGSSDKLQVVTTTGMISDLVKNVGGEHVEVVGLMGPGIDPHSYRPTAGDVQRMENAQLIIYNGLHLEGKMADNLEAGQQSAPTVAVAKDLDPAKDLRKAAPDYEGTHDPHIWFDVQLWMKATETVRDALVKQDPENASAYRANADRYLKELQKLHDYVKTEAEKVPADKRVLITAHDAFYYFGQAYGFEVRGLQGISTVGEASPRDVDELATFIAGNKIPAIFVESSVSPRNIKAVQNAVQGKGFEVAIGGELFSDALGNPGTPEGTYVGMVRHNIDTIVKALSR